ncbi:hypothetical protein FKO01_02050 [Mesorhizobium sp. B2-3-3]|nr:hypothetical protein FKO01_02050 [Mesorhizobium sp. B2-3-3]
MPDGKPLRTFLELLFGSAQFRTENRFALFLELLFGSAQFRTENRFALFLELLSRAFLSVFPPLQPPDRHSAPPAVPRP